jgi:hypothetical protein
MMFFPDKPNSCRNDLLISSFEEGYMAKEVLFVDFFF